jgi:hypothetical protein
MPSGDRGTAGVPAETAPPCPPISSRFHRVRSKRQLPRVLYAENDPEDCFERLGLIEIIWSGRRASNPRPQPWQGAALIIDFAHGWKSDFATARPIPSYALQFLTNGDVQLRPRFRPKVLTFDQIRVALPTLTSASVLCHPTSAIPS